ncbi:unnamed protein product [Ilex paraguariensis]|uniref:Uncharacterized protein n=1 Tax=Ilex paraguariensis TaxID=185542 RepID=A0ABC8T383_9AQUA
MPLWADCFNLWVDPTSITHQGSSSARVRLMKQYPSLQKLTTDEQRLQGLVYAREVGSGKVITMATAGCGQRPLLNYRICSPRGKQL